MEPRLPKRDSVGCADSALYRAGSHWFGQSGKPDVAYRFADHVRYLDAFLAESGISSAYVVAQDWGTALAFHLAARKPEFVRGLAFMEFIFFD